MITFCQTYTLNIQILGENISPMLIFGPREKNPLCKHGMRCVQTCTLTLFLDVKTRLLCWRTPDSHVRIPKKSPSKIREKERLSTHSVCLFVRGPSAGQHGCEGRLGTKQQTRRIHTYSTIHNAHHSGKWRSTCVHMLNVASNKYMMLQPWPFLPQNPP